MQQRFKRNVCFGIFLYRSGFLVILLNNPVVLVYLLAVFRVVGGIFFLFSFE